MMGIEDAGYPEFLKKKKNDGDSSEDDKESKSSKSLEKDINYQ
jgi:hypothetical protein